MTPEEARAQQDRVHAYLTEVMRIVSGIPVEEATTTLTLAVAALMIVLSKDDRRARATMAENFARQLRDTIGREDIVEWIKAHTTYVEPVRPQ